MKITRGAMLNSLTPEHGLLSDAPPPLQLYQLHSARACSGARRMEFAAARKRSAVCCGARLQRRANGDRCRMYKVQSKM